MDANARAHELLETQNHMTVATADDAGKPWVSPVFFVHDENYSLYWVSSKTATHSINIRQRPEVGIVIFVTNPDADAVYFDALAVELEDEAEMNHAIRLFGQKEQSDKFTIHGLADVTGDRAWRIYKATPRATYARADAVENDQAVTVREPIDLA